MLIKHFNFFQATENLVTVVVAINVQILVVSQLVPHLYKYGMLK